MSLRLALLFRFRPDWGSEWLRKHHMCSPCHRVFLLQSMGRSGNLASSSPLNVKLQISKPRCPKGVISCQLPPKILSGPQKQPAERGHVNKCQKSLESVKNILGTFLTSVAQGKESPKSVKNIFDTFRQFSRGTNFPAPFGGL